MRIEIVDFLKDVCSRYGLSANYQQHKDIYVVHKRGYAIQNFNTEQFYQIPKPARRQLFIGLLQRGLTHNLGEGSAKNNLLIKSQLGIRIV